MCRRCGGQLGQLEAALSGAARRLAVEAALEQLCVDAIARPAPVVALGDQHGRAARAVARVRACSMKRPTARAPSRAERRWRQRVIGAPTVRSASAPNSASANGCRRSAASSASRSRAFQRLHLRPRRVERGVRQALQPALQRRGGGPSLAAQKHSPLREIGGDQVEAVVARQRDRASRTVGRHTRRAATAARCAPRDGAARSLPCRVAHVGQQREPAGGGEAEPGAAALQVAARRGSAARRRPASTRPARCVGRSKNSSRLAATTSGKRRC